MFAHIDGASPYRRPDGPVGVCYGAFTIACLRLLFGNGFAPGEAPGIRLQRILHRLDEASLHALLCALDLESDPHGLGWLGGAATPARASLWTALRRRMAPWAGAGFAVGLLLAALPAPPSR